LSPKAARRPVRGSEEMETPVEEELEQDAAARAVASAGLLSWRKLFRPRPVRLVRVEAAGAILPGACACCLSPAAKAKKEVRPSDGLSLFIPYCEACLGHAARVSTERLAVVLASTLLGLIGVGVLPLVWESDSVWIYLVVALFGSLLPVLFSGYVFRRGVRPHSAARRAAWWSPEGRLVCTHHGWAGLFSRENGFSMSAEARRETRLSPWMGVGPLVVLTTLPAFHELHHPLLRVVNLTPTRLLVYVDGRYTALVEPTGFESPAGGVELRVRAGSRRLEAFTPSGARVALEQAELYPSAQHLYAPAAQGHCFWLESTAYGRAEVDGARRLALSRKQHFWILPLLVDSWFSENPAQSDDQRSTGGVLTALRQAPCALAPVQLFGVE
jgi:hypothetical protein